VAAGAAPPAGNGPVVPASQSHDVGGPAGGAGVSAVRSWPHVRQTHPSACPRHTCVDGLHADGTPSVAQDAQSHRRPCGVRGAAVAARPAAAPRERAGAARHTVWTPSRGPAASAGGARRWPMWGPTGLQRPSRRCITVSSHPSCPITGPAGCTKVPPTACPLLGLMGRYVRCPLHRHLWYRPCVGRRRVSPSYPLGSRPPRLSSSLCLTTHRPPCGHPGTGIRLQPTGYATCSRTLWRS